jgi:hypothetical protein
MKGKPGSVVQDAVLDQHIMRDAPNDARSCRGAVMGSTSIPSF